MKVLEQFERSIKILPQSIKICGTAFSHINMTVVPDGEPMNIHVDVDDVFTAVLHVGNVIEGGETNFYEMVYLNTSISTVQCFILNLLIDVITPMV